MPVKTSKRSRKRGIMGLIRWVEERITGKGRRNKSSNKKNVCTEVVVLPPPCSVLDFAELGAGEHYSSTDVEFLNVGPLGSPFRPMHHSTPRNSIIQSHIRTSFLDQTPIKPLCESTTGVYSPRQRSMIKTNPWIPSPQSPSCCSTSTSADSGAWTATSSASDASSVRRRRRRDLSTPESSVSDAASITPQYQRPAYPLPTPRRRPLPQLPCEIPQRPASAQPRRKVYSKSSTSSGSTAATPCRSASAHRDSFNDEDHQSHYYHRLMFTSSSSSDDEAYYDEYATTDDTSSEIITAANLVNYRRYKPRPAARKSIQKQSRLQTTPLNFSAACELSTRQSTRMTSSAGGNTTFLERKLQLDAPLRDQIRRIQLERQIRSQHKLDDVHRTRRERLELQRELLEFRQYLLMRNIQQLDSSFSRLRVGGDELRCTHFV